MKEVKNKNAHMNMLVLPQEILQMVFKFLDPRTIFSISQVCQDFRLACDSVCKAKCLAHIPSDIFIELWEELGLSETIDYIEIWKQYGNCQVEGSEIIALENNILAQKLDSKYLGAWNSHTHAHQLICSTYQTSPSSSDLYIGQADGLVQHFDALDPTFSQKYNIEDGSVREMELWFSQSLLVVAGDKELHYLDLKTLEKLSYSSHLQSKHPIELCPENKHISCFGHLITFSCDDTNIVGYHGRRSTNRCLDLEPAFNITLKVKPIQWKLWNKEVIVLESKGEISIYRHEQNMTELLFKCEPNIMLMYKNPSYMFRDVVFCSTSAAVGLIVRTSYWLMGWHLHQSEGRLHRALEQDKINPEDEVWCVALRRNMIACGTEEGCIVLFSNSESEDVIDPDPMLPFKKGHSVVQLEFDCNQTPAFKKKVSSRPILAIDVSFVDDKILLFYRTDIQNMSCLILHNNR